MKEQAVKENRIRNRVSRAVESAFDQTVNGDAVKDRKYIQRYEITLKHFYIEIEQYRRLLPEIKRDAKNQQSKRPTGAAINKLIERGLVTGETVGNCQKLNFKGVVYNVYKETEVNNVNNISSYKS